MHRLQNRDGDFAFPESAEALNALAMVTACEEALHVPAEQAVASRRPQFQGPPEPAPHDFDGNMTAGPLQSGAVILPAALVWDAENRLISTTVNGVTTTYLYDAQSRRIASKVDTGSPTLYLYDGWNVIAEYRVTLANPTAVPPTPTAFDLAKSYLWGLDISGTLQGAGGVGGLLSETQFDIPSSTFVIHYPAYDGNGNVTEYLSQSGAVKAHFEYDPFGNLTADSESNAASFPYRFSTKPQEATTGLYYYTYRYYDPVTGRWPSKDPIEEEGGFNLYGFVGNDGVNLWDLLGLQKSICDCIDLHIDKRKLEGWWRPKEKFEFLPEGASVSRGKSRDLILTVRWKEESYILDHECPVVTKTNSIG